MSYTISIASGKGYINHNNRVFSTPNVDKNRTKDNIILCKKDLKKEYENLFSSSVKKYNDNQKRSDRKINNYYEKIEKSKNGEKLYHEIIFQIGDKNNSAEINQKAVKILSEFYEQFTVEYDSFKVVNAVIHNDESTPHLHLDFIPISKNNKRGLSVKNSMRGALKDMGFETLEKSKFKKDIYSKMRRFLTDKCIENGIDVKELNEDRNHLNLAHYKAMRELEKERAKELNNQIATEKNKVFKNKNKIINKQKEQIINLNLQVENVNKVNEQLQGQLNHYKDNNHLIDFVEQVQKQNQMIIKENEQLQDKNKQLINEKNEIQKSYDQEKELRVQYELSNETYQEDLSKAKNTIIEQSIAISNKNNQITQLEQINGFLSDFNKKIINNSKTYIKSTVSDLKSFIKPIQDSFKNSKLVHKIKYKFSKKYRQKYERVKMLSEFVSDFDKALEKTDKDYLEIERKFNEDKTTIDINGKEYLISKFDKDMDSIKKISEQVMKYKKELGIAPEANKQAIKQGYTPKL